ncbi:MAG: cell division protein SepF [Armatimonadetes bacterium]|nr:cell division protein SepF [Candidatus Hippobium faecium]
MDRNSNYEEKVSPSIFNSFQNLFFKNEKNDRNTNFYSYEDEEKEENIGIKIWSGNITDKEAKNIIDGFREGCVQLIDFSGTDSETSTLIKWYLSGAVYGLEANLQTIGENFMVIAPKGVNIAMAKSGFTSYFKGRS